MRFFVLPLIARWGLLALLAAPLTSAAQLATAPARRVEAHPRQQPKYPGGQRALRTYLAQELRYPLTAYREHVRGKVRVRYLVDEAGRVQEPVVTKRVGFGCDEEALRIVQSLPLFQPGTNAAGQAVAVYKTATVNFLLKEYAGRGRPMPRNAGFGLAAPGTEVAVGFGGQPLIDRLLIDRPLIDRPVKAPALAALAGAGALTAQYPGGLSELFVFIAKQTHYPRAARKAAVEGRVLVSVLIDENGRATDPIVTQGLGYGCDEEAVRVLMLVPGRFSPAQNNTGQAVPSRYEVPVFFPKMKLGNYRRPTAPAWH